MFQLNQLASNSKPQKLSVPVSKQLCLIKRTQWACCGAVGRRLPSQTTGLIANHYRLPLTKRPLYNEILKIHRVTRTRIRNLEFFIIQKKLCREFYKKRDSKEEVINTNLINDLIFCGMIDKWWESGYVNYLLYLLYLSYALIVEENSTNISPNSRIESNKNEALLVRS